MKQRHWQFVEAYMASFSVTKAGEHCNYSRTQAGRIFRRPDVQEAIHARRQELVDKAHVTVEAIVEELRMIAFHPIEPGVVSASDKIKAIDLLGRYLGMWQGIGEASETHTQEVILIDRSQERHEIIAIQNGSSPNEAA